MVSFSENGKANNFWELRIGMALTGKLFYSWVCVYEFLVELMYLFARMEFFLLDYGVIMYDCN